MTQARAVLLVALLGGCAHARAVAAPITEQELVRRTQALFDAIMAGDRRPWKLYYAEDAIFADEKGRTLDKASLVADITPLPRDISGAIRIEHVQSRIAGTAAVLSYDLDESEDYFGQHLANARYHVTDTWLFRDGAWQIVASQAMRHYADPAPGRVDPARLGDYAGTYELTPEIALVVTVENGGLVSTRAGRPREELLPEAPDIFFRKGVEGRRLFHRDDRGVVDALIDRRNNQDIVWKKRRGGA
jgi:hypothetical protein